MRGLTRQHASAWATWAVLACFVCALIPQGLAHAQAPLIIPPPAAKGEATQTSGANILQDIQDGHLAPRLESSGGAGSKSADGSSTSASSTEVTSMGVSTLGVTPPSASSILSASLLLLLGEDSSSTSLTVAPGSSTAGQAVTLTAAVGGASPTGTVTFKDGAVSLGSAPVANGAASFTATGLAAGTHQFSATYSGDSDNESSTSAVVSHAVAPVVASVVLVATPNPAHQGQPAELTATVNGSSPTGVVRFLAGSAELGTVPLSGTTALLTTTALPMGTHSLSAVYGGDTMNTGATSAAVTLTVKAASTVTLSATPTTADPGQTVTVTVTVAGSNPSGVVNLYDSTALLASADLSAAQATFSLNSLATGAHSLVARYAGDAANDASASDVVNVRVRSAVVWKYGYDAMGRMNTAVDPNGLTTFFHHDLLGRPVQSQQPPNSGSTDPTLIEYGYDLRDSLTSVSDPRNLATTYVVNGLGDVKSETSPDRGSVQYTHDAKGNVLTRTDARGKTTAFSYDALDRITRIEYPTGAPVVFEYDGGPTPTPAAMGELTKITDSSGSTSYTHDSLGRVIAKTVVIGAKSFTVQYAWGPAGSALDKLTSITYPSGSRVNYGYDQYGSVSGITVNPVDANGNGPNGATMPVLSGISYNASHQVTGWQWSDGKPRTVGYDGNGQVSSYSLGDPVGTGPAAGLLRTLTRDPAGRITGYSHVNGGNAVPALNQGFTYDDLNRLASATNGPASYAYSYDATGNRTTKTIGGTIYTNTIASNSNRMTHAADPQGTATVTYDAAGNVAGDGANTYGYDDRGRMANATTPGGIVNYLYNGLEQRVGKTGPAGLVPTGAAYYVFDEAGQLLGEYDASGSPVYETIYLGAVPTGVMKQTGSAGNGDLAVQLYNVHADHIATPRVITTQDHAIVWRWDTAEPFGATGPQQNPNGLGVFTFNQRFPGQVFDAETGLFQNWHREYRAGWGRYIQSDPIGLAGGINTFAYVANNPLLLVDPRGLQSSGQAAEAKPLDFAKVCRPMSLPSTPANDCKTEEECWEKARKGVQDCNAKYWGPWNSGKKMACLQCWQYFESQCPGFKPTE